MMSNSSHTTPSNPKINFPLAIMTTYFFLIAIFSFFHNPTVLFKNTNLNPYGYQLMKVLFQIVKKKIQTKLSKEMRSSLQ